MQQRIALLLLWSLMYHWTLKSRAERISDVEKKKPKNHFRNELMEAAVLGDINKVEFLLRLDPDILSSRPPVLVNRIEEDYGRTTSMVCGLDPQKNKNLVDKDCAKIIELLHDAGANLTLVDYGGWDTLAHAAVRGFSNVCKYLIKEGGVNVNNQDKDGRTALMKAAAHGHNKTYNTLVKLSADLSTRDSEGMASIHHATSLVLVNASYMTFWKDVIMLHPLELVDSLVDRHGRNVAMYAAIGNSSPMLEFLLELNINPDRKDSFGIPLTAMSENIDIRQSLIDASIKAVERKHKIWLQSTEL